MAPLRDRTKGRRPGRKQQRRDSENGDCGRRPHDGREVSLDESHLRAYLPVLSDCVRLFVPPLSPCAVGRETVEGSAPTHAGHCIGQHKHVQIFLFSEQDLYLFLACLGSFQVSAANVQFRGRLGTLRQRWRLPKSSTAT